MKASFFIQAIHCDNCARAIQHALGRIPGVQQVEVDVRSRQVSVEYDWGQTSPEAVAEALYQAGFPPVAQQPEPGLSLPLQAGRSLTIPVQRPRFAWYLLLVLSVLALALAGYTGYVLYPRFDLPALATAEGATLMLLAAGASIASFFSPCAFPLLVTFLARETGVEAQRPAGGLPAIRVFTFAGAFSLGATTFLILSGIVIAIGGQALFAGVTFDSVAGRTVRGLVGITLITLGLMQSGVVPLRLHVVEHVVRPLMRSQAMYRRRRPVLGFGIFGFGYVLAGFG